MIDTTQAFFARLTERGYEPLLHSVTGTIRTAANSQSGKGKDETQ